MAIAETCNDRTFFHQKPVHVHRLGRFTVHAYNHHNAVGFHHTNTLSRRLLGSGTLEYFVYTAGKLVEKNSGYVYESVYGNVHFRRTGSAPDEETAEYAYISDSGNILIPYGKYSYIDEDGGFVICDYEPDENRFHDSDLYDRQGKLLMKNIYGYVRGFSDDLLTVYQDAKTCGLLTPDGKFTAINNAPAIERKYAGG